MSVPLSDNHPNLPMIEDAKQGIQTLSMYLFTSLMEAGFDVDYSKGQVASLLEQQYYHFCQQGSIQSKSLGSVETRLAKVLETLAKEAQHNVALRTVYSELLTIQTQLKR